MSAAVRKTKLLLATNIVSCPKCFSPCLVVSGDGERIIIRHAVEGRGVRDCSEKDKLWTIPQATISATEV